MANVAIDVGGQAMTVGRPHSRCETPNDPPLELHYYQDQTRQSPVADALRQMVQGQMIPGLRLTSSEVKARQAEVRVLLDAAKAGTLTLGQELKRVSRNPDLWEIRFTTFAEGEYRMYHGEPATFPGYLVAVHLHLKAILATPTQTRTAQNAEIDVASNRYMLGRSWRWGIP